MIERIIEYSIRNRFLVMLVAAALAVAGIYAVLQTPIDAIPDLSENQVIVFTDWMGRSPQEIEDQITYPLSLKLQGLAGVKAVRSSSEFNFSMITLIFEDNVGFYFARERVLERLTLARTFLPEGVTPYLAPDATALGQIFWYTLEGGRLDPGRRWALQKYYVGPELNSVPGVAEVADVGGLPLEYQIDVDPNALRAYGVTLGDLYQAVAQSNSAVGGRVVQKNNAEYVVRGVGWLGSLPDGQAADPQIVEQKIVQDLEDQVVKEVRGTPVYLRHVARVQVGSQFRRSVFEKDGSEVVGAAVVMRYGENPLAVTQRVKHKIQELQSGLPPGVHIVPAYDRTRLIHGAIANLAGFRWYDLAVPGTGRRLSLPWPEGILWHEMLIATLAVLLILVHVRSAFVICITLPLSVLFSFLMMGLLRWLRIVDVQANIMSLAGITISIGILVDQAIVMVENATHHLKAHFGDKKVTGDTQGIVIRACRTVGRPIFFSVLIILISFIPVFAMSGNEGKYFHPMAFTKSLAMVGVALLSVTLVPALIPTLIKGRLRGEEENWIVRSLIQIYQPVLAWALERRNLVMWAFAALLIVAIGLFPLEAVLGLGASHYYWQIAFFAVLAMVVTLTVLFTHGWHWQVLSLASLVLLGLWAYDLPKIGVAYMPALEEGSVLDMPVTVPRLSTTQAADDLKARNALLRSFPEVESVVGKSGRADTPTDPAPLEMVETFVNFRPVELWPRRAMKFDDAARQVRRVLGALEERGYIVPAASAEDRAAVVNEVAMRALTQFDETMRDLANERYREFERRLEPLLTRVAVAETIRRLGETGQLEWPADTDATAGIDRLTSELAPVYGRWLARNPALEDVTKITQAIARRLVDRGLLRTEPAAALALHENVVERGLSLAADLLGLAPKTFAGEVLNLIESQRLDLWRAEIQGKINWELLDRGVEAYTWAALEETARAARSRKLLDGAPRGAELVRFAEAAGRATGAPTAPSPPGGTGGQGRVRGDTDHRTVEPFIQLRRELEKPFAAELFLWRRQPGKKGDLLQELDAVVQSPGWSNIWTKPIQNRVDMLNTGVRTPVGIKVYGPDLATIDRVCKQVEQALLPLPGARYVNAVPIMGKGYLEIRMDRNKAARYGVRVQDIQDTIEVALGGKAITQTVEGGNRFPVRIRYARAFREDEQTVRHLLVSRSSPGLAASGATGMSAAPGLDVPPSPADDLHVAGAPHGNAAAPLQVPLSEVADVRIVEGPATIPSENGRLVNYVLLVVGGERDIAGFVDEAQRLVSEKVAFPEGVHLEWSGEFEHQVRAAKTLRIIFPAVIILIFLILYLTYKDVVDAGLMLLAVPEALAGGVFFQYLFPKILHGWSAPPVAFSVAVWVGYIAAFGMATETGIIMLVYLREAIEKRGGLEKIQSLDELKQAVMEGAVHRLRPKLLTEGVAILAIAPMLFSTGVGSEILSAMALPVLGGLLIADEVVDIFLPVRFYWVRRARWLKLQKDQPETKKQAEANGQASLLGPAPGIAIEVSE
jgi:Cu/Ag efflux pump CusA